MCALSADAVRAGLQIDDALRRGLVAEAAKRSSFSGSRERPDGDEIERMREGVEAGDAADSPRE